MKRLALVLFLFSGLIYSQESSGVGYLLVSENFIALDKQAHGAAGLWLGAGAYSMTYEITKGNRKKSKFWGIATPILIGTLKELSDNKAGGTGFDWADLGYTAGGGIVATYTLDFLIVRKNKRNK